MAGRGVDIKLGGELPEDVLRDTNRVLAKFTEDPYALSNEERVGFLAKLASADFGIYEESVKAFLTYMDNMKQVHALGGLHVIGSERHEARRIDNQLRGRAARQGDPGSSRFYLSLEDDLMRLFGGAQVEGIWKRMMFDDSQPIELGMLGKLVEQSQERVEGSNFDIRKHLLEYDDVLNSQRKRIYGQRDRVFTKEDLSDDVIEMLHTELENRIQIALKDKEGPWKLLAFLEEIQPAFEYEQHAYPSFAYRLLIDEIRHNTSSSEDLQAAILELADQALSAERDHTLRSVQELLDRTEENLKTQISERTDILDTFFSSIGDPNEDGEPRRPAELLTELNELLRVPVRLTTEQIRLLPSGDETVQESISQQVDQLFTTLTLTRLLGALERRLDEPINLKPVELVNQTWQDISSQVMDAVTGIFEQRIKRLLGPQGIIQRDLDTWFARESISEYDDRTLTKLLVFVSQGTRTAFDAHTHRKSSRTYNRLNYVFLAARMIEDSTPQAITERVVEHFENGLLTLEAARGSAEWNRLKQADITLGQLDARVLERISLAMDDEKYQQVVNLKLADISPEDSENISLVFGKYIQNEINRHLLLRVISDQWVEYLTKMEALRVSIGLEAYGQRDPLVQYKGKASEMFQELLADVRMAVISRIFTYQMRRAANLQTETDSAETEQPGEEVVAPTGNNSPQSDANERKKRKRHHR